MCESVVAVRGEERTLTFKEFVNTVHAAHKIAYHITLGALQLVVRHKLGLQSPYLVKNFIHSGLSNISADFGGYYHIDHVAFHLDGGKNAIAVAFVLAYVHHQAGTEITAKQVVSNHHFGEFNRIPRQVYYFANAYRGLHSRRHIDASDNRLNCRGFWLDRGVRFVENNVAKGAIKRIDVVRCDVTGEENPAVVPVVELLVESVHIVNGDVVEIVGRQIFTKRTIVAKQLFYAGYRSNV